MAWYARAIKILKTRAIKILSTLSIDQIFLQHKLLLTKIYETLHIKTRNKREAYLGIGENNFKGLKLFKNSHPNLNKALPQKSNLTILSHPESQTLQMISPSYNLNVSRTENINNLRKNNSVLTQFLEVNPYDEKFFENFLAISKVSTPPSLKQIEALPPTHFPQNLQPNKPAHDLQVQPKKAKTKQQIK